MPFSRRREVGFLLGAFMILGLGYFVVWQTYLPVWQQLGYARPERFFLPPAAMLLGWLTLSAALTLRRCRETLILPIAALLIGIGLLFLLRLAGGAYAQDFDHGKIFFELYKRQLMWLIFGWAVLLGMTLFWREFRTLAHFKYVIAATAILLLLATTLVGGMVGGQTLTLRIGPLAFQPHDPVKLLLVIFMAAYLAEKKELIAMAAGRFGLLTRMDFRYMGPLVLLWLLIMAIVFKHKDLGAAVLLFGAFLGILYLGTGRKNYLLIGLILMVAGMSFAYFTIGRVHTRVAIWQNPWAYERGDGFQICQSLMALGNGRVIGAGLGGGFPERIPAVETDFIYAAISEDLGLLGAVFLVGLVLALIGRLYHIALQAEDRFGQLLVAGLATTFAVQAFVILGGVVKLIPLTGVTLPFVSYGGTSLVMNLVMLGIALKVAEAPKTS